MIKTFLVEKKLAYDGKQLSPHWIYNNFDILGDSLVAFIGECSVPLFTMVDLMDVKQKSAIYSPEMLHFVMELFDENLLRMVFRQRLFIVTIKELLEEMEIPGKLIRSGDDIYWLSPEGRKGKLSVSIATKTPVSTLMHTGINIRTQGAPVPAAGLEEMGIEPRSFAQKCMDRFLHEMESCQIARCKVNPVYKRVPQE